MRGYIDLPREAVAAMKERIWASLRQEDADVARAEYARILAVISHPAAVFRGRLVKGTRQIQAVITTIILWRRACWPLYIVLIAVAVLRAWWVALMCPVLFLVNLVFVNHWQTVLNVELAARLFLLDELSDRDGGLGSKIRQALQEWK